MLNNNQELIFSKHLDEDQHLVTGANQTSASSCQLMGKTHLRVLFHSTNAKSGGLVVPPVQGLSSIRGPDTLH